jgi:GntR family transcriptional regulator, rspAB operon transcriptional repressor
VSEQPLSHYPDLGDRVYSLIREQILSGALPPGSLLLGVELARDFGVSRTPVADALNVLAAEGLLEVVPRKGYFVTSLDTPAYLDLLDARLAIELAAVERGITRASASQRATIRRHLDEMNERLDGQGRHSDHVQWIRQDGEFHEQLVELSGNNYLVEMHRRLNDRVHLAHLRLFANAGARPSADVVREHEAILAAFERCDLGALKAAISEHLDGSVRFYATIHLEEQTVPLAKQDHVATKPGRRLPWIGKSRLVEQH